MPFESNLPEWKNPGQKPPDTKIEQGWGAGEHPPADWWNWQWYRTYKVLESLITNAQHKEEKGKPNGYASLDANGKVIDAEGNTSTYTATANTIMQRDPAGRAKVAAPVAADDIARLDTVQQAIANLINGAPGALDTLIELSNAMGGDANFSATVMNALANKVDKVTGKGLSTNDYTDAEKQKSELFIKEFGGSFVATSGGTAGLQFSSSGLTASWTAGVGYVTGRRFDVAAGNIALNATQGQYIYLDVDGVIKNTTSQAAAEAGLLLWYFATDASQVITSTDRRRVISPETFAKKTDVDSQLANKVDKITGKGLSTNDYTDEEKQKVSNLGNYGNFDIVYNAVADSLDFKDKANGNVVKRLYRNGDLKIIGELQEVTVMKIGNDMTFTEDLTTGTLTNTKVAAGALSLATYATKAYDNGTENVAWVQGYKTGTPVFTKNADNLYLEATYMAATWVSDLPIDFTNLKTLKVDWANTGTGVAANITSFIRLSKSKTDEAGEGANFRKGGSTGSGPFARTTDTYDVSSLTGTWYVKIFTNSSFSDATTKLSVYQLWTEDFDNNINLGLYKPSGTRVSPAVDLTPVKVLDTSKISWTENKPTNTTVVVETSIDNGTSWQQATNGAAIPGITADMDVKEKLLLIRETLTTTDATVTPNISNVKVELYSKAG